MLRIARIRRLLLGLQISKSINARKRRGFVACRPERVFPPETGCLDNLTKQTQRIGSPVGPRRCVAHRAGDRYSTVCWPQGSPSLNHMFCTTWAKMPIDAGKEFPQLPDSFSTTQQCKIPKKLKVGGCRWLKENLQPLHGENLLNILEPAPISAPTSPLRRRMGKRSHFEPRGRAIPEYWGSYCYVVNDGPRWDERKAGG